MTKTLKWLGGGLAAAMLLAAVGLFSGNAAEAQGQPPTTPSLFGGTVTVDGDGAAAGTVVTAVVDGENCASGIVRTVDNRSRVPRLRADATPSRSAALTRPDGRQGFSHPDDARPDRHYAGRGRRSSSRTIRWPS